MKKIYYIIIGLFVLTTISCTNDFLDVNTDPLAATDVPAGVLFTEAAVQFSSNRTVELNAINIQAQQWASNGSAGVFSRPERYSISTFTTGNSWGFYYTTGLKNLLLARLKAEQAEPTQVNTVAQIKTMEAFIYYNITNIWGEVPFTEALSSDLTGNVEFPNPKFDNQDIVLKGIVTRLDEALALFDPNSTDAISDGDVIYGGNIVKWQKFANSLKLKTLMLIANKEDVSSQIEATLNAPMILTNDDEADMQFLELTANANPLWGTLNNFAGGTNPFWFAGATLVDLMNANNDPRRSTYFDDGAPYVGLAQGDFVNTGNSISLKILRPDYPDRYATAAETKLLLAEAAAKGYITGGMAQANTFFREGIQLSLDWFDGKPGEMSGADKTAFINSFPDLSTLSNSDALKMIQEQQYVDLFSRGLEAWTNWRRTKVPTFTLPINAQLPDIIRRYPYPPDEIGSNPNTPSQLPLETPMWYEN